MLLARAGFRRHTTYRMALLAGMTTNSVFGVIRASVLLAAVSSAGAAIAGYDAAQTAAFVWWGQAMLGAVNIWGFQDVRDRVRSGDIAIDFLRPVDPQLAYLAADLGRAGVTAVARGVPALTIGALLFDLAWPPGALGWVAGLLSVALAVVCAFGGSFIINLLSFWIVEIRGVQLVWLIVSGFFCGLYLPIPWFPDWLEVVARLTPFPAMMQIPIDILVGRVTGSAVLTSLAVQVLWAVVLLAVGQAVMRAGRRRLEVQGG